MDIVVVKSVFLRFVLLPLLVIFLALLLGYLKKKSPKIKLKVLIVYLLLAGLCLAVPGIFGFSGNLFNPFWYLIAMLIYLFLGVLHVNLLNYYFTDLDRPLWYRILFQVLITLTCMLFGAYLFCLLFSWVSAFSGYALMASTSMSIFIIPLSFYYCFIHYINIPLSIYKTWQYKLNDEVVDFDKIEFRTLLLLNLELTKTVANGQKTRIDAKAPSDGVSIGAWFYRVVNDYNYKYPNSTIHLLRTNEEPYSWIFYTKKSIFHFRKFLDFDKTMSENNMTAHTTIICKRVINNEIENEKPKNNLNAE